VVLHLNCMHWSPPKNMHLDSFYCSKIKRLLTFVWMPKPGSLQLPKTQIEQKILYSEQKNCLITGQISLVRQIAAQITKVNPWENIIKVNILSAAVPNNKHSASFVDFMLTLRWDPSNETVFCTP